MTFGLEANSWPMLTFKICFRHSGLGIMTNYPGLLHWVYFLHTETCHTLHIHHDHFYVDFIHIRIGQSSKNWRSNCLGYVKYWILSIIVVHAVQVCLCPGVVPLRRKWWGAVALLPLCHGSPGHQACMASVHPQSPWAAPFWFYFICFVNSW